ncbi:hypothetical protein Rvan_2072 [Rhodomicrobium vannielii ATCC 17100]|uniref:Uncharacterized protein n=1 Tax=Rhodomicrobium vannielii (strain ATCC 17100 / DSM 162 / LMG 4299 / NCIMB 10020 / ATH 3.1.1) TaxID=648757 RepID=E3I1Z8_RHOVT|nr:hypothetical protein Rvan_2072 [Rhodomicrobium vannielii ATCC 17100]
MSPRRACQAATDARVVSTRRLVDFNPANWASVRLSSTTEKMFANIPPRRNRKGRFVFSGWLYRQRHIVERFFNKIKQLRGIATRYDKDPANFLTAVKLIATRLWCTQL